MAPKYKLTYFNATGLGEPIRYMFAYGKIEYEDNRIEMGDWPQHKSNTGFGKIPVLEVDGKQICQSSAICRYLGKQLNIAGKTDWDALQADMMVDILTDLRLNYTAFFRSSNDDEKAKILDGIKKEHNPFYLSRLDKIVEENGGNLVKDQLTWADLYFAALADLLENVLKEPFFDSYKNLLALRNKVNNLPGIKEYRATRPTTLF